MKKISILFGVLILGAAAFFTKEHWLVWVSPSLKTPPFSFSEKKAYNAKTFTLGNGLQVVLLENHRAPIVFHSVWYRVGSMDDPVGKSGLAHFLEHLLFKGTKKHPKGFYDNFISRNGGMQNAFTGREMTCYYAEIAKPFLEKVMELEADRMQNTIFDPQEVLTERKVILEERRDRTESSPSALLGEAVNKAIYWHHPYGIPVIGWMHEMEDLQLEDVQAYYKKFYTPKNAFLILAGDVTEEEAKTLAQKYYGSLKNTADPKRRILKEPPHHHVQEVVSLRHHEVAHPSVGFVFKVDYPNGLKDYYALSILDDILFSDPRGYLHKRLVEDLKVANSVGMGFSYMSFGQKVVQVSAEPAKGISLEKLEKVLQEELKKIPESVISKERVQESIDQTLITKAYDGDHIFFGARAIGMGLCLGVPLEDLEKVYETYADISQKDVQHFLKDIFQNTHELTVKLLPQGEKT